MKEISTPNVKTIDELAEFLKIPATQCAKSLIYLNDKEPILILMEGNDQLNESKLHSLFGMNIRPAHPEELLELTGADAGSIGAIGLKNNFKIFADKKLEGRNNLVSGANKNDFHILNVDLNRDTKILKYLDLRTVENGEDCNCGKGKIKITKGIEVGHIFKLGTKYSESMKANFLDENGKENPIIMGSYGIGVERIMACHLEQNHDANGIFWDKSIAPYLIHLICVNSNSEKVVSQSEKIYSGLNEIKFSVLFDDRKDISAGFKFKDADLLGMPLQIIVGEKNLSNDLIELKERSNGKRWTVNKDLIIEEVKSFFLK